MRAWQDNAACKNSPTEWFYPEGAEINPDALYLCETCPVRNECRDYGVVYEEWGIWGGLSASQRRRVRKEFGIVLSQSVTLRRAPYHDNCGTNAGYHNLYRHYERFPNEERIRCQYCYLAHSEYTKSSVPEEERIFKRRERYVRDKALKARKNANE